MKVDGISKKSENSKLSSTLMRPGGYTEEKLVKHPMVSFEKFMKFLFNLILETQKVSGLFLDNTWTLGTFQCAKIMIFYDSTGKYIFQLFLVATPSYFRVTLEGWQISPYWILAEYKKKTHAY